MATQYTSTRIPVGFIRNDGSSINNGSLALANTVHAVVENQHWLCFGDTDLTHFINAGPVENATRIVTLLVPPFCQYASFHFFCARDFNGTSSTLSYIDISSPSTSRRTTVIPYGEDLSLTAKPSLDELSAGWVHFEGMTENPSTITPTALRLFDDASVPEDWTTVDVTVTISAKVYVFAAAYRVLPPSRVMVVKS